MVDRFNCRVGAVMASVMAEALDEQQVHIPKVSKYENLTALAKTLKEDPSCQLCSALKRYVFKKGVSDIETNLDAKVRGWIFFHERLWIELSEPKHSLCLFQTFFCSTNLFFLISGKILAPVSRLFPH